MFVDRVQIEVTAGNGGDGCCSFRRERYIPKGGPDGGDGGHGGSVIIVAVEGVDSLSALAHRRMWRAEAGRHGSGANRHGRSGKDLVIQVPPGTVVLDAEQQFVIKDLVAAGEQFVAARGGKGGKGNTHFKSATNQAPRQCTPGEEGEQRVLTLELKVIADVGLIGKPNAGKSTLLSRLSRARPEIADYPFTTKFPHLGRVQIDSDRSFVLADIPGLIEGAHSGVGLGHEFLRHVERAGILVHLVEPTPPDGSDPVSTIAPSATSWWSTRRSWASVRKSSRSRRRNSRRGRGASAIGRDRQRRRPADLGGDGPGTECAHPGHCPAIVADTASAMNDRSSPHLVHLMVADVGNSAIKLGRFLVSTDADRSPDRLDLQLDGVYPTVVSAKDIRSLPAHEHPPVRLEAVLMQLPPGRCGGSPRV